MSKTDKDKPWWVQAEWYEPVHDCRCVYNDTSSRLGFPRNLPCTLPARPHRHRADRHFKPVPDSNYCTWEPVFPHRYHYEGPPTKKDRHYNWWGPARAADRDAARQARDEYRGGCELSEPRITPNHRHCSIKGWWN